MNIFHEYDGLIGKLNLPHLKNSLHDFFELTSTIRNQLGNQAYLLDKYVCDLLKSITAMLSCNSASNGFSASGDLRKIILGVLDGREETKTHPLYEKAKDYIDGHPLPYQELSTRVDIYYIALVDDFLEHITAEFYVDRKDNICRTMDIVESEAEFSRV